MSQLVSLKYRNYTREELFELVDPTKPYFRFVEFPVVVKEEIELWIGINESHQAASTG
jgi:hypothetical protein